MQAESEVWTTVLFNRYLAAPLDALWSALGMPRATWIYLAALCAAIVASFLVLTWAWQRATDADEPAR